MLADQYTSALDQLVSCFLLSGLIIPGTGKGYIHGSAGAYGTSAQEERGIPLTPAAIATVIATATIASIGTAGVPSVGLVTLSMVLTSVGLPTEGIALIMGIDRILDMLRTAVNITGDAVCTTIVAKQQGAFNENTFRADN